MKKHSYIWLISYFKHFQQKNCLECFIYLSKVKNVVSRFSLNYKTGDTFSFVDGILFNIENFVQYFQLFADFQFALKGYVHYFNMKSIVCSPFLLGEIDFRKSPVCGEWVISLCIVGYVKNLGGFLPGWSMSKKFQESIPWLVNVVSSNLITMNLRIFLSHGRICRFHRTLN